MTPNLNDLLTRVAAAKPTASRVLEQTIAQLEAELAAALDAQLLRGLPNLGTSQLPLYGLNLRAQSSHTRIPFPCHPEDACGSLQLVLTDRGQVKTVQAVRRIPSTLTTVRERPWFEFDYAPPGDVTARDLTRLLEVLPDTLLCHLAIVKTENEQADAAIAQAKHFRAVLPQLKKGR